MGETLNEELRNRFALLTPPTTIPQQYCRRETMPASRRGSGSVVLPSGQTIAIHTRTQDEEDLPHATKRYVARVDLVELPAMQPHAYTLRVTPGRWRTISENTRLCQSCLDPLESRY